MGEDNGCIGNQSNFPEEDRSKDHGRIIGGIDDTGKPWYGKEFDSPSWLAEWYQDKVLSKLGS